MADLKKQKEVQTPNQFNKNTVLGKEHRAAAEFEHHHSAIPAVPVALNSTRALRSNLQNSMAVQMAGVKNTDLFPHAHLLKYHLHYWTPKPGPDSGAQWMLKQRMGMELNTLKGILFQERLVQETEAGLFAVPQKAADISSSSTPSLEKLDEDLKALAAFMPALPAALAEAVKNFQEEYDVYVSEEKLMSAEHPSRHSPAKLTHDTGKPQPQE